MRGQAFSFVILCRATLTFAKPPEPIVSFTSAGGERRHDMHDHALKMLAISGGYTASFDIGRRDRRRRRNEEERGEKNRKLPLSSAPPLLRRELAMAAPSRSINASPESDARFGLQRYISTTRMAGEWG